MTTTTRKFAICIRNEDNAESLELRKIYEILDDETAAKHGMVRVIDEEQEDYLYPADWFLPIALPHNVEVAILEIMHS
ncbi:MAG TPA: hypothetical protein VN605_00455 [Thermoanaerobaculia bacterium]|nr:hypothetical protein [Thermoanaerobaculia bacterium]